MSPPQAAVGSIKKRYFSWEQLQNTCLNAVEQLQREFEPTHLVGISGGGLIPARILRTGFKAKVGRTLPIQCVGAWRYDDDEGTIKDEIIRTQWLSLSGSQLSGTRLCLIDEVDDSRKTLAFIVDEFLKFFAEAEAIHRAACPEGTPGSEWIPPQLGVFVIHNKVRVKEAAMSPVVYPHHYWVGEHIPNMWCVYPWDCSTDIHKHTALAQAQEHYFRARPQELAMALAAAEATPKEEARELSSAHVHYADGGSTAVPDGVLIEDKAANGRKAVSALTSALQTATSAPPSQEAVGDGPARSGSSVVWQSPEMYTNIGYIPNGLAPRIGSLTLVDNGSVLHHPPPGQK